MVMRHHQPEYHSNLGTLHALLCMTQLVIICSHKNERARDFLYQPCQIQVQTFYRFSLFSVLLLLFVHLFVIFSHSNQLMVTTECTDSLEKK